MVLFVWLQLDRSQPQEVVLAIGAATFVLYLLEIGYVIYLRSYGREAAPSDKRRSSVLRVMGPWFATMAAVSAFGLLIAFVFPDLMKSFPGQVLVFTVTLGGVAVGLVRTMTGPFRRSPPSAANGASTGASKRPSFWRVVGMVVGWQVAAAAIGVTFFGPVMLLQKAFDNWIDIPACRRRCESGGFQFQSFIVSKSSYSCMCAAPDGPRVFHERAYVGGGDSCASAVGDWLLRAGTSIAVGVAWPAALIALFVRVWSKRKPAA